ncbi:hypothetical protein C7T94_11325 [Pedobacter yulinensis]|uniref:Uncharacterized protein n=1 Tax=Pedobacter yulinensis TaxID=2126353 RepID=A0A2T3HL96_9SPHI|nr:hypothetical protein C7T94_11325 [Pedobacter yulinensis]
MQDVCPAGIWTISFLNFWDRFLSSNLDRSTEFDTCEMDELRQMMVEDSENYAIKIESCYILTWL